MLQIGFGNVGIFDKTYQRSMLEIAGTITLGGKVKFGGSSRICVMPNARLGLGDNFCNTAKLTIACADSITIGTDFLCSWDTIIMDTDWHAVENTLSGDHGPVTKPITIGNNVWMGMRSVILKGSLVPDNCIIAAQSVVNKRFTKQCCLLAGSPAEVKKENVRIKR